MFVSNASLMRWLRMNDQETTLAEMVELKQPKYIYGISMQYLLTVLFQFIHIRKILHNTWNYWIHNDNVTICLES